MEERLPKHQSFVNWIRKTRASIRTLTVFYALFAGPRSFLNTIFESITNKAKWVELLTFFPNRKKIFELNTWIFYQLWLTFFYTKFLSARRTSSPRLILEMRFGRRHPSLRSTWWPRGCWGSCASPRPVIRS